MMMEPKGPGGHSTRGSHRMAQAGTCDRKWFLRWARGLKPNVGPVYFVEGTLAHVALAYYRANQLYQRKLPVPAWFHEETMFDCLTRNGVGYPNAVQLGKDIYAAYAARYDVGDKWEPISIEEEYKATLGQIRQQVTPGCAPRPDDGEVFTCRIDLMVRTNGFLWACDYKTTKGWQGKLGRFNPEGEWKVNWQFALQTIILRINFGTEFRGVVVERVCKTAPYDSERMVAPLEEAIYRSVPATLSKLAFIERTIGREALEAQAAGADMEAWLPPATSPWACFSWGQPCEYRNICTAATPELVKETVVREYHVGK